MVTLIGISGKKQSGKDTVGRIICDTLPHLVNQRIAFADALKEEVAHACEVKVDFIEANKERFRPILQWWGTDFRRHFHTDQYWLHKYLTRVNNSTAQLIITPDVRFLNEAQIIKEVGGFLVRVRRGNNAEVSDTHASEVELDHYQGFDYTIQNDSPMPQLVITVHDLIETLRKKGLVTT